MRPLTLAIDGLRSYRHRVEVDFTDVDLVGIVGDTGAGKSSLLEGLCVALYNGSTWDARGAKALIADGADVLRVELTFRADDATWLVRRAISKGAYPPPIHSLECLDDGRKFDGADAVLTEVKRLVGVDFNGFLKAVVLPQGRFQVLLQSSQSDRTTILKNILRVDQLGTVREHAISLSRSLRPKFADRQAERARLLPDPVATLRTASATLKQARKEQHRLDAARVRIEAATEAERHAADESKLFARHHEELSNDSELRVAVDDLDLLMATATALTTSIQRADAQLEQLEKQESELRVEVESADDQGIGAAGVATATAVLEGVAVELARLETDDTRRAALQTQLVADEAACDETDRRAEAAKSELARASTALTSLHEAAAAANQRLADARGMLTALRSAAAARAAASGAAEATVAAVASATAALEEARAREAIGEQAFTVATTALDTLLRANAAAHAAHGRGPGDPCPVCETELPGGFTPRPVVGESDARAALSAAEQQRRSRADERSRAEATLAHAQAAADGAAAQIAATEVAYAAELKLSGPVLGESVELDQPDDVVLGDARRDQANAATKLYDATAALEPRRAEATRLAHDAQLQRRALGQAREALTQADATARIARDQLAARAGDLPPVFQPGESLTPESIDDARKRVATASAQANQAALALKAVRDQLGSARNAHGQLLQRKAVEVDGPQQRLLRVIDAAGHHAAGALLALGADPLGPRPDEPLDAIARWARDLLVRMADATSACAARVAAATAAASEARNTIGAERQRVGATNAEEFNELVVATATDIRRAEGEHNLAEAHAPLAADLDQRIARAGPFLDALDELSKLLADGKFVASVVKRKQRVLLAVASELLGEMSGRRFGFAEDFQIVDRLSGQPRDTKTLSGGETFLASLALALALVELAGRGGGRLEALFLDEGFGSLDANVLGDALDVLSRQAEGGRLVAVISHLRAVAENIEHVLLVTKDATGSDVRWVQGAERDALVESEASSGLVS